MALNATKRFLDNYKLFNNKEAVMNALSRLALAAVNNPNNWDEEFKAVTQLSFSSQARRIRIGDYRLIFVLERPLLLLDLGHRKTVYDAWNHPTKKSVQNSYFEARGFVPPVLVDSYDEIYNGQQNRLNLANLGDVRRNKHVEIVFREELTPSWTHFLSEEQYHLKESLLERFIENEIFQFHLVIGSAGTGKTQILIELAKGLNVFGLNVISFFNNGVQTMLRHANYKVPGLSDKEHRQKNSIHLLDDPEKVEDIRAAYDLAKCSNGKGLVVTIDPFQWKNPDAFEEFLSIVENPNYAISTHYLYTNFRQAQGVGRTALTYSGIIFEQMGRPAKQFPQKQIEEFVADLRSKIFDKTQFVHPGGAFISNTSEAFYGLEENLHRIRERQDLWTWTSPILMVWDESVFTPSWGYDEILSTYFLPTDRVKHVMYSDPEAVRGLEYQEVLIMISKNKYDEFDKSAAIMGDKRWELRTPFHTFVSRAKDAVVLLVR
jgi:mRNA-degrading endonuclease RelE of RelBE toxin-antitoxin system/thymidine kinase